MAELSRFFADVAGDRLTTAAQWNRIFNQILQEKDGVIRGLGNTLAVTNAGTVSVDVNTGSAVMGGRLYENTASKNLVLDAVTSGSKRYDRIVVRVDETARTMLLTVINGVEGASPAVPAVDGTTDVLLAKILLDRSSGSYVYTVTDERVYCDGLVLPAIIAKLNLGTFSLDDTANGTTSKKIDAAKADAINGGTFDADKVDGVHGSAMWYSSSGTGGNDGNGGQPPMKKGTIYSFTPSAGTQTIVTLGSYNKIYLVHIYDSNTTVSNNTTTGIIITSSSGQGRLGPVSNGSNFTMANDGTTKLQVTIGTASGIGSPCYAAVTEVQCV